MPSGAEHVEKYRANRVVLVKLRADPEPSLEWIAIVAFYCAVHLIEALAAEEGEHHLNHDERFRYLSKSKHAVLHKNLKALSNASQDARYESQNRFQAFYRASTVDSLLTYHLKAIEDYVLNLLNDGPSQTS